MRKGRSVLKLIALTTSLSIAALSHAATYQFPYNNGSTLNSISYIRQLVSNVNFDEMDSGLTHTVARKGFDVYTWGKDNSQGQLGRPGDPSTPTKITLWYDALGILLGAPEIDKVVSGDNFCLALEDNNVLGLNFGRVFFWGTMPGISSATPIDITGLLGGLLSDNLDVAAGANHFLILNRGTLGVRRLFSYGANESGQCGVPSTTNPVTVPTNITSNFGSGTPLNSTGAITNMSAGHAFSSVIRNGKVYSWGDNTFGQLACGNSTSTHLPKIGVGASGQVTDASEVSCGYDDVVLRRGGTVSTAGHKTVGILGRAGGNTDRFIDIGLTNIASISAGYRYNLALTTGGDVYQWGFLVIGADNAATYNTPTLLPGYNGVASIHAGNREYDLNGPYNVQFQVNTGGLPAVSANGTSPLIYRTRLYDPTGTIESGQKYVGGDTGLLRVYVDETATGGNGPFVSARTDSPLLMFTSAGAQVADGMNYVDIPLSTVPVDSSTVVQFDAVQDNSYWIDRKLTVLRPRAATVSLLNVTNPGMDLHPGDTMRIQIDLQQPTTGNGYTFSYTSSNHRLAPAGMIAVDPNGTSSFVDVVIPAFKTATTLKITINNGNSAANVSSTATLTPN